MHVDDVSAVAASTMPRLQATLPESNPENMTAPDPAAEGVEPSPDAFRQVFSEVQAASRQPLKSTPGTAPAHMLDYLHRLDSERSGWMKMLAKQLDGAAIPPQPKNDATLHVPGNATAQERIEFLMQGMNRMNRQSAATANWTMRNMTHSGALFMVGSLVLARGRLITSLAHSAVGMVKQVLQSSR